MTDEQDNGSRTPRFAPRERADTDSRQPFRTSLIFVGIGIILSFVTVLWLGLFNEQDEIRLDVTDIKVDETGEVELTGAVYRGQTARGEPYEITADTARVFATIEEKMAKRRFEEAGGRAAAIRRTREDLARAEAPRPPCEEAECALAGATTPVRGRDVHADDDGDGLSAVGIVVVVIEVCGAVGKEEHRRLGGRAVERQGGRKQGGRK